MHYAIADIHGCYDLYQAMLEKIGFSDDDVLVFLGDAADRGPDGIRVMQDLMRRRNAFCLLGNHEHMFWQVARYYGEKLNPVQAAAYRRTFINWTDRNGGDVTWDAYLDLPEAEQKELLSWMEGLPTCGKLELNGTSFILAHAGVGVYAPEKDLESCELFDFIWERMDYNKVYYPDKLLVTGHTPTVFIDQSRVGRIIRQNNHIAIDCGAVYVGILGCICLETLEEFYVSRNY